MQAVVLDTNIVISAAISKEGIPAKIIELQFSGKINNFTTDEIIEEIQSVFQRPAIRERIEEKDKEFIISNFKTSSTIIKPAFDEDAVKDDSKDNKFVNCALSANAIIISGDGHLLKLKRYKGTRIISAREFLETSLNTKT